MVLSLSKKIKIIFILIILICYYNIGCINVNLNEKIDKVKIGSYSVKTFERLKVKCC